jgi:hypothetical protein
MCKDTLEIAIQSRLGCGKEGGMRPHDTSSPFFFNPVTKVEAAEMEIKSALGEGTLV